MLAWARDASMRVFVLGGGSNLVVSDGGFDGVVIKIELGRDEPTADERGVATVGAGHDWDAFVAWTVERNLAGLECLSGIPGLVGATPIQNVGAYGQEVAETVVRVDVIDRRTGEASSIAGNECAFRYRDSEFKRAWRDWYVITRVAFALVPGGAPAVRYPELERHLRERGDAAPSLARVREAVIGLRRSKSMVLDPADENRRSAGSFFTNPIVSREVAGEAERRWRTRSPDGAAMPAFPAEDRVKLAAAWLIERSGFEKGTARGNAGISTRHCLALVNRGSATSSELLALAREVKAGVFEAYGVSLVPEPELVGFAAAEIEDLVSA